MLEHVKNRDQHDLLGRGLYTAPQASRLTGIRTARLARWLWGYTWEKGGEHHFSEPLWESDLARETGERVLEFRDLMEARVVHALVDARLALPTVRRALAIAREKFAVHRPLSTRQFKTDGRGIFLQMAKESSEPDLIDLVQGQYAFNRVVEPSFIDLDFGESGEPLRWWPLSKQVPIVVDPVRSFGQPIDDGSGVPTVILYEALEAEGNVSRVAKLFDVSETAVRHSAKYERSLAA